MKVLLYAFLCAIVAANARTLFNDQLQEDWENYKIRYQKSYKTPEEEKFRFKIFTEKKEVIEKHNKKFQNGQVTYKKGINQFSDMLSHEIVQTMNGFKPKLNQEKRVSKEEIQKVSDVPESVDWVKKGAVTPVKTQGTCGSCWAFSATGALEGRHFVKKGQLISLSEQNLMDCSVPEGNYGCQGGTAIGAFDYVIENHGIDTEKSYPYQAAELTCRYNASAIGATEISVKVVPSGDEEALKAAVAEGPVSIAIDASPDSFHDYAGGIYQDPDCMSDAYSSDHEVLLVGYGFDEEFKLPYWLIKNSWSPEWGDNGYIKILRDNKNICGVTTTASYPVV